MAKQNITLFTKLILLFGISITILINQTQAQVVVVPLGGLEPLARAQVDSIGGVIGSGIKSVNNSSTGIYEITFKSTIGSAPIVLLTPFTVSSSPEIMGYGVTSSDKIKVRIFNGNTGAAKDSAFSIMVIRNGS